MNLSNRISSSEFFRSLPLCRVCVRQQIGDPRMGVKFGDQESVLGLYGSDFAHLQQARKDGMYPIL